MILQEVTHFALRLPPDSDLKLLDMFLWLGWKIMPAKGFSICCDVFLLLHSFGVLL